MLILRRKNLLDIKQHFVESNCGVNLNMKHMRLTIAHHRPSMIAIWFWKLIPCLNFELLDQIVAEDYPSIDISKVSYTDDHNTF